VLKIRSKKLSQIGLSTTASNLVNESTTDLAFFDTLNVKLGSVYFFRKNLNGAINTAYSPLLFKKEVFYNFNFLAMNQFKVATFFV
jgi:hypothetical protein